MRSTMLLLAIAAPLFADAKEDAIKAELEKFQGTWQLVSVETEGQAPSEDVIKTIRVVITGNKHTVHVGDQVAAKEIPFTLDPAKKPKENTDTLPDGKEIKGIYELDGDTLKSCVAPPGKDRPTEFKGKGGNTVRVFKKVKD
ncbi:MAG TPA: TIGR03067 domain-containing protein [Gemmataceae bacterium]|jgi:uncharacterized protein (TIGR03067 family)|nr:TIGR03067 domain-containing protein [Gemmataceae bacterium]